MVRRLVRQGEVAIGRRIVTGEIVRHGDETAPHTERKRRRNIRRDDPDRARQAKVAATGAQPATKAPVPNGINREHAKRPGAPEEQQHHA